MQHIVMVTGKGGVGKSLIAAVLAKKLEREGRRTLLVEMTPQSYLAPILGIKMKADSVEPHSTPEGFDLAVWTGEACLTDYVQYLVKVPWVSQAFLGNSWMKALIQIAPGLREISFLGKLTSQIRQYGPPLNYDHIVVDAVSTGHFLNLLRTPRGLAQVVRSGPMKEQSESIQKVLDDPRHVRTLVVTNLESYSVQESMELLEQHEKLVQSELSFVANKVFPVPPSPPASADKSFRGGLSAEAGGEGGREFIEVQNQIKDFQNLKLDELKKTGRKVAVVPHFFESFQSILGEDNDIRRLFNEL